MDTTFSESEIPNTYNDTTIRSHTRNEIVERMHSDYNFTHSRLDTLFNSHIAGVKNDDTARLQGPHDLLTPRACSLWKIRISGKKQERSWPLSNKQITQTRTCEY